MNEYFTNNLRFFRSCNQYTQEDMGKLLNISRQTYNHYETGYRTPDLETFLSISTHLNVPMEYFFMKNPSVSYIPQNELTMFLNAFYQLSPTAREHVHDTVRKCLMQ